MALSKSDHAQIKLAVMEGVQAAMHGHKEDEHKPLCRRVDSVERKIWWASGAAGALAAAGGWLLKALHSGKVG